MLHVALEIIISTWCCHIMTFIVDPPCILHGNPFSTVAPSAATGVFTGVTVDSTINTATIATIDNIVVVLIIIL